MFSRASPTLVSLLAIPATLAHGPRDARWQRPPAPAGVVSSLSATLHAVVANQTRLRTLPPLAGGS